MSQVPAQLIGREELFSELFTRVSRAAAGSGSAAILRGEPGIGKTRLLEEVARRAQSAGVDVFWGRAWEAGGAPAYWPLIEVLRGLFRRRAGLLERLPSARRSLLGQLLPQFAPHGGPGPHLPDAQARFMMLDAISRRSRTPRTRRPS